MEFASQICTTREQSERLLSLGLKKKTADFVYRTFGYIEDEKGNKERIYEKPQIYDNWNKENDIPAWSLHRLIEMMPISIRKDGFHNSLVYDFHRDWCVYMLYANGEQMPYNKILEGFQNCNLYDNIIDCIEWLIKEGYFNKEYLV